MKKLSLVLMLVLTSIGAIMAQRTITGTVVDAEGEPLIGATVLVKGTSQGTVTDIDGDYSVEVPADAETLIFSYTGFQAQEIVIGASNFIDVTMEADVIGLDDVIVTGYSTKRKKDITGSVSSIDSEDFQQEAGVNIQSALRGRSSGVVVQQTSGAPGSGFNVRVRGATSINASNRPLYVIDGVPVIDASFAQVGVGGQNQNTLADLNPNDIESIEVLKDASAAAIYGSRGANGVVLITTKKGQAGDTQINFDASYGINQLQKKIDIVDGPGYRDYMEEIFGSPDAGVGGRGGDSDWQEEIFQDNPVQNYALSLRGGNEQTRFYASMNYQDDQGILDNTRFTRYSGRLNLDNFVSDKFSWGMNLGYTFSDNERKQNDNNIFGAISTAILLPPTIPIRNEDGTFGTAFGLENPLAAITLYQNEIVTNRVIGKVFGNYKIIPSLTFQASLGVDALSLREDVFEPSGLQSSVRGTATVGTTTNVRVINEYTLTFQKRFDNHSLTALAGLGLQEDKIDQTFSVVNDFPGDNFTALDAGSNPTSTGGDFTGDNLRSYFGNIDYSFDDRYILTMTLRADGSSRFINDRYGVFPGISAAWRLSEENFMGGDFFQDLKLRGGWGQNGNNNIGNFVARQLSFAGANYQDNPGLVPGQLGNANLVWETTTQTNIGVDFTFLNSRVSGSVDWFRKVTEDLLFSRPIPTTSGFTSIFENIGEVENTGVDISLTTRNLVGAFNWTTTLNLSYLQNEVNALFDDQPIDFGFATRLDVGQPIGAFYGYVTDGIFQNQSEVDAHATQPNAAPGDFRFKDVNDDGRINDQDRAFIGQALPKWSGGFTSDMNWKGLTLNLFFQYSIGNDIYNNNLAFAEGLNSVFAPTERSFEGAWREEGDGDDFPRVVAGDPANNRRDSDRFLEDGTYLRLKTATLAYNFPAPMLAGIGMKKLRVYVSGTNLLTFTDYSWYDPEVNTFGDANVALGTDFLTYPQARTILFGVNVGF